MRLSLPIAQPGEPLETTPSSRRGIISSVHQPQEVDAQVPALPMAGTRGLLPGFRRVFYHQASQRRGLGRGSGHFPRLGWYC